MANRYWIIGGAYPYSGTNWEEKIDVLEYLSMDESELEKMSDKELQDTLCEDAWRQTIERCDAYAYPADDKEFGIVEED